MLREQLLSRGWLVYGVVAWGVALAAAPYAADPVPLPPVAEAAGAGDLGDLRAALEGKIVRGRLLTVGLSPAGLAAALERLTPVERSELAARAQELSAGVSGVEFLAFGIILAMLVVLILELMGRRVISRP
jgi:hypothetical protein